MRAWTVRRPGRLDAASLPVPEPAAGELLVRVRACGVCRTDLHVRDRDLPPHRPAVVPGHEVVGEVIAAGPGTPAAPPAGTRVGIAWLRRTCGGTCRYCTRGQENLCPDSRYTGWDADGGYAQYATVPADFAYELPDGPSDAELAPLLCAGIIGYRALRLAELPEGGRLGVYGFGGSAHLTAQLAIAQGAEVHVFTRSTAAQELARTLGAASAGPPASAPAGSLDAALLFAPAGALVPVALEALDAGGTLSVAGIHVTEIPALDYDRHLFRERTLRSVTANTRADGRAFLHAAAEHGIRATVTPYPFDHADTALDDLAAGKVRGVAVLQPAAERSSGRSRP
ncbi:zinc-dependent alcohol dehydrogenase family protein [Streptomyces boninensis]|uniref:zinc-dependent alcohol dehydrogenase family protein n=1 Tax=Streptomyces boninensis TaxID=2039455 RepID=UPI003B224130